jgi:glycosyltransferase involved in cell wall biosynthesis
VIKFAIMTPSLSQPGGAERLILIQVRYGDPGRMQCTGVALSGYAALDANLGRELRKHTTIHGDPWKGHLKRPDPTLVETRYKDLNEAVRFVCREANILVTWGSPNVGRYTAGLTIPVIGISHAPNPAPGALTGITHLVTVAKVAYRYYAHVNAAARLPVRNIPNGVEVDRACPRQGRAWQRDQWGVGPDDKVMLFLGRHARDKNLEACIRPLVHLPPEYRLIMQGNQAHNHQMPMPALVAEARRLGVEDRVMFLPPVPFVGDVLAGADCMIHPSLHEADSLAIKEAFLAGLPVVHAPAGSIPEMEAEFGPVGWGLSVNTAVPPTADSLDPEETAAQVRRATSDEAKPIVAKMRTIAWEQYSGTAVCNRWADYMEEIVAEWNWATGG